MANEGYPERSIEEVEALADSFSAEYFAHIGQSSISTPIPVEDMAEHYLGFAIDITDEGLFSDPDFIGGIDFDAEKIYVNTSIEDHDGRYAFTVAHEIGHYVLHKAAYLENHNGGEKKILSRDTFEKPQIEVEADRFAAALLMPSTLIREAYAGMDGKKKVKTIGQARALANHLIKEAGFDNVSNTAMINRLIDLKIIPSFVGYQTGRFKKNYGRPALGQMIRASLSGVFRRFRV